MDVSALATGFLAATSAQTQMAVAAKLMKMNADSAASIVAVIEAAQQNLDRLANLAPGIGQSLDITA